MNPPEPERANIQQLEKECSDAVAECMKFLCLSRDSKLQKEQSEKLTKQKDRVKSFKYGAVSAKDEKAANRLFGLQCVLNAYATFLDMLRIFKSHDFHKAWGKLIDTQDYIALAIKASDSQINFDSFSEHVAAAERSLFPGFAVYQSWGAVIRGGKCSICGQPMLNCEHLEGKVYWGRLCIRVGIEKLTPDHVALVENPKDRRCIITETTFDGSTRDYFTWKEKKITKRDGSIQGVFFNNKLIEID